jgi:hypothetical protein
MRRDSLPILSFLNHLILMVSMGIYNPTLRSYHQNQSRSDLAPMRARQWFRNQNVAVLLELALNNGF